MLLKGCTEYASKFGKLSSGHRTGKAQFSFPPQRRTMPNYHTVVLISHASKVMLKIRQARLQQYVNWELPDVQAGCTRCTRKGRGTRNQIANIHWIIEKARQTSTSLTLVKPLSVWITANYGEFLKRWELDRLSCLPRNLNAVQEATDTTEHGTTVWFTIGKGVRQCCILSLCLFNL